ncbi:MAG: hypothetical protein IIX15_02755 [Clostridia bacterium]|nr:hypothetical protein [Clostridia bacterium]
MGWGLLFIGYFLKFILGINPMFDVVLTLPACVLMMIGLKKLSLYCHTFHYALWSTALLAAVTVGGGAAALLAPTGALPEMGASLVDWLRYATEAVARTNWIALAELIAAVLFHLALALGIKDIAVRVGVQKNAVRAMRNLVLVGLYAASFLLAKVLPSLMGAMTSTATIVHLVFALCNSVLLYSCYMRITPAEETVPERKPSRFALINRLRNAYDEKTQKAIEDDRAYHTQQARERKEKQLSRISEKQRKKEELRQKRNQK